MKQFFTKFRHLNNKRYGIVFFIVFSAINFNNVIEDFLLSGHFAKDLEKRNSYLLYEVFVIIVSFLFIYFGNYWAKIDKRGIIYCYIMTFIVVILMIIRQIFFVEGFIYLLVFAMMQDKTEYSFLIKGYTVWYLLIILGGTCIYYFYMV